MRFLGKIILCIIANALAIMIANRLIPGFVFFGDWTDLLIASVVLGLANSFLKPILKLLAFPIIILTLGLFSIIINIALLYLVAEIVPSVQVDGFWSALGAVIIISFVNYIVLSLGKKKEI